MQNWRQKREKNQMQKNQYAKNQMQNWRKKREKNQMQKNQNAKNQTRHSLPLAGPRVHHPRGQVLHQADAPRQLHRGLLPFAFGGGGGAFLQCTNIIYPLL